MAVNCWAVPLAMLPTPGVTVTVCGTDQFAGVNVSDFGAANVALTGPSPSVAATKLRDGAGNESQTVTLGGSMAPYVWTIDGRTWNDHRPLDVRSGERVEIEIRNPTMMAHPMHLHGHHFQVVDRKSVV